jgi:SynChlorMet cassette radical SAM/SPASM protein ScmF
MNEAECKSLEGTPPLRSIYFYLTEGCNLACRHCWIAPQFDESGIMPAIPVEIFQKVIDEAMPLGLTDVKLTGGEPLMHPRFAELLEIIRRKNLGVTIETNGLLCTPEVAAEIARLPQRFVSVSIDGSDKATHEWMRGVPGCFEKAKYAINNLVEAGVRPQIITTLVRRNAGQIEEIVSLAEHLGASSVKFNIVLPTGRGEKLSETAEMLSIGELIRIGEYVENILPARPKLQVFFDIPYAFRSLGGIACGRGCSRCNILNIIGVIASGEYALCGIGYQVKDLVFGLAGTDSLERIWKENGVLNTLRSGIPDELEGICSKCLMKYACQGSCIAQNFYRSENIWAPFWFCDMAYSEGLFPKTRIR